MKIKFNSDYEIPLNKTIEFPTIAIVVRAVFHENNLYHSLVFLDVCLYKIEKGRVKMNLKKLILFWWYIKDIDFNFSRILSDEKLYENISV